MFPVRNGTAFGKYLTDISSSRAKGGYTPSETAGFVFSLKRPIFLAMLEEFGSDAAALSETLWQTTELLDNLGLLTTETFQKTREDVISRQQQELLELSTPVVRLMGKHPGPAADRNAGQRAHPGRHAESARRDCRNALRFRHHRHHRRSRGGYAGGAASAENSGGGPPDGRRLPDQRNPSADCPDNHPPGRGSDQRHHQGHPGRCLRGRAAAQRPGGGQRPRNGPPGEIR